MSNIKVSTTYLTLTEIRAEAIHEIEAIPSFSICPLQFDVNGEVRHFNLEIDPVFFEAELHGMNNHSEMHSLMEKALNYLSLSNYVELERALEAFLNPRQVVPTLSIALNNYVKDTSMLSAKHGNGTEVIHTFDTSAVFPLTPSGTVVIQIGNGRELPLGYQFVDIRCKGVIEFEERFGFSDKAPWRLLSKIHPRVTFRPSSLFLEYIADSYEKLFMPCEPQRIEQISAEFSINGGMSRSIYTSPK